MGKNCKTFWVFLGLAIIALILNVNSIAAAFEASDTTCAEKALDAFCAKVEKEECDVSLKACLAMFEQRAKIFDAGVQEAKQKGKTLSGEISSLQSKIKKLDNEIQHNTVIIKDLTVQVKSTEESITDTQSKIEAARERLKSLLVSIFKEDNKSGLELILGGENLTETADNFIGLKTLSERNQALLATIVDLKTYLENQKDKLGEQKGNLEDAVAKKEVQKNQNLELKEEKNEVLSQTKGEEALFQQYKQQAEARAAKIRSRIFQLAGISGVSKAPSFGEAIEIAQRAGAKVGVRPSFILAILAQETRIGQNVGKCYVVTEDGKGANGKPVMRANQVTAFIQITKDAGLDFKSVPVSCPIPSMGCPYGGAMGPAQFMPTTWNLFKDQISSITGRAANPWNIEDAFYAAALFVKDAGANAQGKGELKAAARYFGSGAYGYQNQVQVRASCIEKFIAEGTMSAKCESMIF